MPLDSQTRDVLDRKRWRQSPLDRKWVSLALAGVLLLHILFALVLRYEMQAKPPPLIETQASADDRAMVVRLIDTPKAPPPPTPQPVPEPAAEPVAATQPPPEPIKKAVAKAPPPPKVVHHEANRRDAMVVQDHSAAPAEASSAPTHAPVLFARDGSLLLPPTTQASTSQPAPSSAKPKDDRRIMVHDKNGGHVKATRFEKYFPPPNETMGGAAGRHVDNAIKAIVKSVCKPDGGVVRDALCGVPPIPPSPKDGDERLNLPPPPLAKDPNPAKKPPLSTCIAEYRGIKPLSYGCPLNTPDLAYKAELEECIGLYRAGKRLKTWCPADTAARAAAAPPSASPDASAPAATGH